MSEVRVHTARPWLKFYPSDWRGDPRLRMCSLAARGFWIDLICYMHEGTPYGHLTIDGVPPLNEAIAALLGRPPKEVAKALAELEAHRVFDRAQNGAIVSRRMVRDHTKDERDRRNGKAGGNPSLRTREKQGVNPADNAGVDAEDKAQSPEARVQTPERENARAARALSSDEFDQKVWKPYPRTPVMSKEQAWRAWRNAADEDRAAIVAAIPRYAAWLKQKKPDHPVLNLETFIAQRRFAGFAEADEAPVRPRRFYVMSESAQLAAWDAHYRATRRTGAPRDRNGGWWVETEWPPGHAANAPDAASAPDGTDDDAAE